MLHWIGPRPDPYTVHSNLFPYACSWQSVFLFFLLFFHRSHGNTEAELQPTLPLWVILLLFLRLLNVTEGGCRISAPSRCAPVPEVWLICCVRAWYWLHFSTGMKRKSFSSFSDNCCFFFFFIPVEQMSKILCGLAEWVSEKLEICISILHSMCHADSHTQVPFKTLGTAWFHHTRLSMWNDSWSHYMNMGSFFKSASSPGLFFLLDLKCFATTSVL